MPVLQWQAPESIQTALSTQLNSLANNAFSSQSAEINNESGLYMYLDLELLLASFTPGSGSPYCAVWLVYNLDGTNYEKAPNGSSGDKAPDAIFPLEASVAQSSRIIVPNIPIAPLRFRLILRNVSGAALPSSGNTLRYRRHTAQVV